MAGGPPVLNIGAEGYLGWGKQAVFGTPTSPIAANTNNWGEFTAIDLNYDAAWHAVETGAGSQATERKAGRGMSKTQGGFTTLLQPTAGGMLLACFFGADVYGTPVAAAHNLSLATVQAKQMLTVQKIMAGQALQYQDCFLDTLVLAQAGAEWTTRWTVLGGLGDVPVASDTPTLPTDALVFQWGDTTLTSSFGSIAQGDLSGVTMTFNRNIRQFAGAGSYAATRAAPGKFQVSGQCTYLYDSAAAATAQANYISGTESTMTVVLTKDSTHVLTVTMPLSHMTATVPQQPLDELVMMQVNWFARQAEGVTLTLKNDVTSTYMP
jgi:hypothetical protein